MPNESLPTQTAKAGSPRLVPNASSNPTTLIYVQRRIIMYSIAEFELETLGESNASLNSTFFGICFGALASFVSALLSTQIREAMAIPIATLVAMVVVFMLGTI